MTGILQDCLLIWASLGLKVAGELCFKIGGLCYSKERGPMSPGCLADRCGCALYEKSYAIAQDVWRRRRQESSDDDDQGRLT
ncbi:MAG: hypothetical protein ACREDT_15465 [Methylocella sp.]